MLLTDKTAVVYGAGGGIGSAVATAFAQQGARVFLAGRTLAKLDRVAEQIRAAGGTATTTQVDALDEPQVNAFVESVVQQAGSIEISFNVITVGDVQQPLMEISTADFLQPIVNTMRSHFITVRAAAPHMIRQKSGVILAFGGDGPQTLPGLGGFKVSLDALEGLRRQWAVELGQYGIRVITLKTGGIPDTLPADTPDRDSIVSGIAQATMLRRTATLADVGNVAAFVASDQARTLTSTFVNISCGALPD